MRHTPDEPDSSGTNLPIELRIGGMMCNHCRGKVEGALAEVPGVKSVSVDLEKELATVTGTASAEALIAASVAAGHSAELVGPPEPITLRIGGMMCNHCRGKVEGALAEVAGVESVDVDLEKELATVTGTASVEALIAASVAAGHSAEVASLGPEPVTLQVEGMTCNGCRGKVERALAQVEGVESASVDLESKLARITGTATVAALIAAVVEAGKEAVQVANPPAAPAAGPPLTVAPAAPAAALPAKPPAAKSGLVHQLFTSEPFLRTSQEATTKLSIEGMTCASCVAAVEGRLGDMIGVHSVAVSLMEKKGRVVFDASMLAPDQLAEAVRSLGFEAEVLPEGEQTNQETPTESYVKEARVWQTSFLGSLLFTLPVFALAMVLPHTPLREALDRDVVPGMACRVLLLWLLVTPVQFGFGRRFYRRAYRALKHGSANMDVLVALGTSAAYFYSVIFTVLALATADHRGRDQPCFETSAMLITFILLGKCLETSAKAKASESISKLLRLQPNTALRCEGGWDKGGSADALAREVPVAELVKGDVIKVLPGAQVPADGVVLHGASEVDQSMITGESLPVLKHEGDRTVGGTINGTAVLWIVVSAVGTDTVLAKIMRVVSDAQLRKPQIQNLADRVSGYFVPTVIVLALLTWLSWSVALYCGWLGTHTAVAGVNGQMLAFMFGCAVLVIACPCAMGLATPTAVMVGSGVGAAHGILFKGGDVLEKASAVSAVIFDKTGTLTTGKLSVVRIECWGSARELGMAPGELFGTPELLDPSPDH